MKKMHNSGPQFGLTSHDAESTLETSAQQLSRVQRSIGCFMQSM